MTAENPYAGQGPVLLDIGGDVGALVVVMPTGFDGVEVEIRPVGHDHAHEHAHAGGGAHTHDHLLHVAVVDRSAGGTPIPSLVFPELVEGDYDLYVRPSGPVVLTVTVTGGEVTQAAWPGVQHVGEQMG